MERAAAEAPHLINFLARRAARILPMYWVSLGLAQIVAGPFDLATTLSNAVFAADVTHAPLMIGVYWTLYIEVRFYATVPILRCAGEIPTKAAPYVAIALNTIAFAYFGQASHLLLFTTYCLAGMQISLWQRRRIGNIAVTCCVLSVSGSAAIFTSGHPFVGLVPVCGAIVICAANKRKTLRSPLTLVGRISYSWYLLHTLLGYPLTRMPILQPYAPLVAVVTTFAASFLSFYLIELPAITAAKMVTERIAKRNLMPM